MPSLESGSSTGHEPLVAEPHVDARPVERAGRAQRVVASFAVPPPESAIDAGAVSTTTSANALATSSTIRISPCRRVMITDMDARHGAGRTRTRAEEWRDRPRRPRFLDELVSLAARVPRGRAASTRVRAGLHLPYLGAPGGRARRRASRCWSLAREAAPDAWPRAGRPGGAAVPARAPSVARGPGPATCTCRRERLPLALRRSAPRARGRGAGAPPAARRRRVGGSWPDDDFAGRWFAAWEPDALRDVARGRRLRRAIVRTSRRRSRTGSTSRVVRARTLPDTVGPGHAPARVRAEPVGVLGRRRHRLRAARATGSGPRRSPPGSSPATANPRRARAHGIGMTDLVKRATPRADELTRDEYRDGLARVERLVRWLQPGAVCFVGLAGWRAAVDRQRRGGSAARRLRRAPRLRDAEHERAQRADAAERARRPPPRRTRARSPPWRDPREPGATPNG